MTKLDQPITGVLFQSYGICHRQVWLMARKIIPDQDNQYIEIGRLLDDNAYKREKKKIMLQNMEIDIVKKKEGEVLIGEVKKSSKALESAKLQLGFYLWELKKSGVLAKGVLMFPKEKKRVPFVLTPEMEIELEKIYADIELIIQQNQPPEAVRIKYCGKCAYEEFCWS
jgi:CRISPR-associated exonuclease Cas4